MINPQGKNRLRWGKLLIFLIMNKIFLSETMNSGPIIRIFISLSVFFSDKERIVLKHVNIVILEGGG